MKIDLRTINSIEQLHSMFKDKLGFPDWYGRNWDAFWDAITGIIETPIEIEFFNWTDFESSFPRDSKILASIVGDYNKEKGIELFKIR